MNRYMSLAELDIDEPAVIKSIELDGALLKRVYDLGFLPEVQIKCVQKAPKGSPIAFEIKETIIALRKKDAEKIFCKSSLGGEKNE